MLPGRPQGGAGRRPQGRAGRRSPQRRHRLQAIACVYQSMGEYAEALEMLQMSLDIGRQIRRPRRELSQVAAVCVQ